MTGNHTPLKSLSYTGTNLASGEFYHPKPGIAPEYGKDFLYPSEAEFDYFIARGMNVFRLPFLWETLQQSVKQPFISTEMDRLKEVVLIAVRKGSVVILDPHNYARYYGQVIGGPEVSTEDFADFWARLAMEFRGHEKVWFGLVNEPCNMPTRQWLAAANAAIAAIRDAGAENLILVPGNRWSGAHSWMDEGDEANGLVMTGIEDPSNHYVIDSHQYLDSDSSGTTTDVVSPTIGSERLTRFTIWCREHRIQAFLGEFAGPDSDLGRTAIEDMLTYMENNQDVWIGYTWWSAGPLWKNYMFDITPRDGNDKPQMAYLLPHVQRASE